MSFPHLHVSSGYSLRYGASTPTALVEAAAAQGMDTLALTDRDGLYGAVKFVLACRAAGVAPILGVDLAVEPTGLLAGLPAWADPAAGRDRATGRTPVRGGASVDPRLARVTVLARGTDAAAGLDPGAGWARLCRLVSDTHLRGERSRPVASLESIAAHATVTTGGPGGLVVLLGPDSEVGRAVLARRPDVARAVLARWAAALPAGALVVEVVCHHGPQGGPASVGHAARMLTLARDAGLPAVLTNAVRYVDPSGAATADVLDAARRLVPLDERHLDRVSAEGYLAGPGRMAATAHEVARAAGDPGAAATLLATTDAVAAQCRLDPQGDLGLDSVHLPENHVLGLDEQAEADIRLRKACEAEIDRLYPGAGQGREIALRLDDELETIRKLGFASYFLTVQEVCKIIRGLGVRVAARGSGAGSLVNYLLGISGVDPLRYGLLMERFLTPLRIALPDIDLDVESARRTEVYEAILERFGAERVACVSMMDTYRIRHAIRDVGAALGMPPGEIDLIAKSFPHIRARDVRHALVELPELRASGIASSRLDVLFDLVEALDGLPRHVALHPCGVLISDATLLDRTPVEASWLGFPMSQFDKDDVEQMGLLKLDVLGIRMQSAMAYAVQEIQRVDGPDAVRAGEHDPAAPYIDPGSGAIDLDAVPHDDDATYRLIRTAHTLGCFQIESPGQRELVGKFGPERFLDLIIDISLFRPGPVKSDMVTPFLRARQGWDEPDYLHERLAKHLAPTAGVVVFHEQVLEIIDEMTGCGLAQADEVRRTLGSREGQLEVEEWFRPVARRQGFDEATIERVWEVLKAFASFGFCKAHAAAFALPTYQSAWLKAHHPAAFLAGVLTHDPGMYPKRLILDDARNLGIAVLPLDVNRSGSTYRVEKVTWWDEPPPRVLEQLEDPQASPARERPHPELPDGRDYGIRLALADVKGITEAEVERIVAGRPYHSLADFWHRAGVSRPVVERLVVAGAFDTLYGLGSPAPVRRRGKVTRRDLLLQVAELDRWTRAATRHDRRGRTARRTPAAVASAPAVDGVREAAARQSQAARAVTPAELQPVQLALDLGDAPDETVPAGLTEMTGAERVRAELEVLGLDASRHVLDFYTPLLDELGVTRSRDLLQRRSRSDLLVAGVKVATQTPPIRSGRRVVFLTLDDATGPVDATFFEDVQGPYAATVFHSWLLVVRGVLRRTGPRGVSLRATGAWELPVLWDAWTAGGIEEVRALLESAPGWAGATEGAVSGAAASRSARPVLARPPVSELGGGINPPYDRAAEEAASGLPVGDREPDGSGRGRAGGMGGGAVYRRVFIDYATGYRQSPYADVGTPGDQTRDTRRMAAAETSQDRADQRQRRGDPPRKLWHASPGSSGR